MTAHLNEAVELLAPVVDRLRSEAQDDREVERAALLTKLAQVERAEATRAAEYGKVRAALEATIAELETELQAARRELNELAAPTGFTAEKLRGKLCRLADPRIAQAIQELRDLEDKARHSFRAAEVSTKKIGGRSIRTISNAEEINATVASVREAVRELEALMEAERPDDLAKLLEQKIQPIKIAVQRLHGLH